MIEAIRIFGFSLAGVCCVTLYFMFRAKPMTRRELILSQAENSGLCESCEEPLAFDWGLGDYPIRCGSCEFDAASRS